MGQRSHKQLEKRKGKIETGKWGTPLEPELPTSTESQNADFPTESPREKRIYVASEDGRNMSYITNDNGSRQVMFLVVMSLLIFLSVIAVTLRLVSFVPVTDGVGFRNL